VPGIDAIIRELIAAGVAQHVGVRLDAEICDDAGSIAGEIVCRLKTADDDVQLDTARTRREFRAV
jgi:hypothetical protein